MSKANHLVIRRRSLVVPSFLFGVTFLALCWAGIWQVQRLSWKLDLIKATQSRIHPAAKPVPPKVAWPSLNLAHWQYQLVRVPGTLAENTRAMAYGFLSAANGKYDKQGAFVFSPLTTPDGGIVWVNRGFVPDALHARITQANGLKQIYEPSLVGLLRPREQYRWPRPAPDFDRKFWFHRDPFSMSKAFGLDESKTAPFTLDLLAGEPGELPQAGETMLQFSNPHLGYAITWFGLASVLLVVFVFFLREQRQSSDPQHPTNDPKHGQI